MDRVSILDKSSFDLGLSAAEQEKYSVSRAILVAGGYESGGLEYECSQALGTKMGRPNRSGNAIFVPSQLRPRQSGLDTKQNTQGGYTVATVIPDLIEMLRQQMRCVQLGATFVSGLTSNVSFATETGTTSASWVSENPSVDVPDVDMTFGSRGVSPHTLQSSTSLSRQLLAQNSVDLEKRVRMDLTKSHAIALDAACINGSGNAGQPVGLLQYANLPTVSVGVNGGAVSYANICSLEQTVADAHADFPGLGFLTTPLQRNRLRQVAVNGTGSEMVWDSDDAAGGPLGYKGAVSKSVPNNLSKGSTNGSCHAIIAGNFSEMMIVEFGALEIVVDPFAGKKQGMVEICTFGMVDVLIRQTNAFAVIVDAT